jgi:hypothetical protein
LIVLYCLLYFNLKRIRFSRWKREVIYIILRTRKKEEEESYIYIEGIDDDELVMEEMPSVREPPIHSQLDVVCRCRYISNMGATVALCSDQYQQYRVCRVYVHDARENVQLI